MSKPPPSARLWALLLILGAIWGSSFMSVAVALEGFGPLQVAAIRITLAAVIVAIYAWATGREVPGRRGDRRIWLYIAGFAFFSNALPFSLLGWGMQHVASGFAGVTMAVVPLMVLPLAHYLLPDERMTRLKTLGFAAGFAGTMLLIGPEAFAQAGGSFESLARLACIGAAASYALGGIITRLAPQTSMLSYAAATLVLASLMIVPYAIAYEGWPVFPGGQATLAVLFLAIVPTAIATLIMVHIIRTAGPSFLSLVNYMVPLWSVAFGSVLLSEVLPPSLFAALALILGGLAIAQAAARKS